MAEHVAVRNDCPANITYDLLEYGLQGIRPGDVVLLPAADAARLLVADTVWSPADDAANEVVAQLQELHLATLKVGEADGEPRTGVEAPLGETADVGELLAPLQPAPDGEQGPTLQEGVAPGGSAVEAAPARPKTRRTKPKEASA